MKKAKKVSPKTDISKEFRHLGVMIESVGDDVKLVAEQYVDLRNDVKSIKQTVESHTEMIGNLSVDLLIVKEDIEFIKGSLKKKVDVDEFSALERRVSLLEKHSVKR
ncbi:MAG: hypothetical protein HY093_01455 [Candidatus Liptonbacteria bacterium]|nr:hypothetical protein [Candidatus Liptonbacteria bacterium]